MSHLHIPDGVLPPLVWLPGLVLMALLLWWTSRLTRHAGPREIAYQSALGGIMLAVMAIPMPITAFDYCMTLAGPVGVLLGGAAAFQTSFAVTLILALLGQGGFTVVGLNTVVLGFGAVLARKLYDAAAPRMGVAGAMGLATATSQAVSSLLWVALLALSVKLTPHIAGEHEVAEGLRFIRSGALIAIVVPLLVIAIVLES